MFLWRNKKYQYILVEKSGAMEPFTEYRKQLSDNKILICSKYTTHKLPSGERLFCKRIHLLQTGLFLLVI